ncbi:MAG TPA: chloramphenicol acetyltransferase [Candidatus Mediterraneibacter merdavium]|nr:chloramphenicol acetyltransferase [Candidatus Mediterraneibacter merdavium]
MDFKYVNMDAYKRKEHFEYFSSLAYPYVGVTVNVDITELLSKIKEKRLPFFLTVCYCVGRAANAVPEFRQRIQDGQIVEYDHCRTSHTVALDDGTYCYCNLESDMGFADYIPYAVREQEKAKEEATIHEEDNLDMIFISTLPWLSYTSLVQPVPMPADSNPRITWGKYFQQEGKTFLPLSVLCHHALADGLHIARFYEQLDKEISTVAEM